MATRRSKGDGGSTESAELRVGPHQDTLAWRGATLGWYGVMPLGRCVLLFFASAALLAGCGREPTKAPAQTRPGELDLTHWRVAADGPLQLTGQWQWFAGELRDPTELPAPSEGPFTTVPSQWLTMQDKPDTGGAQAGLGQATYALHIALPAEVPLLALRMPEPNAAHRLWVNGQLQVERGRVASSPEAEGGSPGPYTVILPRGARGLSLVLQASNHQTRTGGLMPAPVLGAYDDVLAFQWRTTAWQLLLLAVIATVAFYHVGLYAFGPGGSSAHLWFAGHSLVLAGHMALVYPDAIVLLSPWPFSLSALTRAEYLCLYSAMGLGLALMGRLFPDELQNRRNTLFSWLSAAACGLVLLTPATLYTRSLGWFSLIALLAGMGACFDLFRAAKAKRPRARVVLAALTLYLLANVHDVLLAQTLVGGLQVFRVPSSLLFLASQAFSLARGYAETHARTLAISRSLTETNRALLATSRSIERFVPHEFFGLLQRRSITEVQRGDSIGLQMGVLFCDIRDFTPLVESLSEREAFAFINRYLSHMEPAIHGRGGFINQYLGDGIMALFPGGADDAVHGALDMLAALERFNLSERADDAPLCVGIGVHVGPLMLGAIGGQHRLDSGVVGDAVNVAARMEGLTKTYGVPLIVSEATVTLLQSRDAFSLRPLGEVTPKGKREALRIYAVDPF